MAGGKSSLLKSTDIVHRIDIPENVHIPAKITWLHGSGGWTILWGCYYYPAKLAEQKMQPGYIDIYLNLYKPIICVDFSFCCLLKNISSFYLEQNSGCSCRQAFIHYCGLYQV